MLKETINYKGVAVTLSLKENYFGGDKWQTHHLEIRTKNEQPIPITETGYKSIFYHGKPATMEEAIDWFYEMISLEGMDNTAEDLLDACGELTQEPITPKHDTPYTHPKQCQEKHYRKLNKLNYFKRR